LEAICEQYKPKRINNIYTGGFIACDPKGNNFSILQRCSKSLLALSQPAYGSEMPKQMFQLLYENMENDGIHDVIFKVFNLKLACIPLVTSIN